jgi:hypothetical protein
LQKLPFKGEELPNAMAIPAYFFGEEQKGADGRADCRAAAGFGPADRDPA